MIALLVGLAGGIGAVLRFQVDRLVNHRRHGRTPLGTLVINLTGSGLLGLIVGWVMYHSGAPAVAAVLGTGFLGGYTSFSTACVEGLRLLRAGRPGRAAALALGGLVGCAVAAGLGLWLMSL